MWSVFVEWLGANYPLLFAALALIIITGCTVWFASQFYYTRIVKVEEKLNDTARRIDTLPCKEHEQKGQELEMSLNSVMTFLQILSFSYKKSPRRLNDAGTKIYEDCGGEAFLEKNKEILLKALETRAPKTALDVETGANMVLTAHLDSDIFNDLKNWVYVCPTMSIEVNGVKREHDITMSDVCFVLSLPLRDMYLDLHPELKVG